MVLITAHPNSSTSPWNASWAASNGPPIGSWAELVYDGLWFSPLKTALESFVAKTQEKVTGEIRLVLHGGHIAVNGLSAAPNRCTTSTWPPTTRATPSTSPPPGLRARARAVVKIAARRDLAK